MAPQLTMIRAIQRRAPTRYERRVAWHLKQAVTQKEHAGAKAERSRTESEIGIHLERRKPYVNPIEPCCDVEEKQKRDHRRRVTLRKVTIATSGRSVDGDWICSAPERTATHPIRKNDEARMTNEAQMQK